MDSGIAQHVFSIIYLLRNGEKLNRGQRSVVGVHATRHQDPVLVIQPVQRRVLKAAKATTTSKCRLFISPDICAGVIFARQFERLSLHLPVPRFHVQGLHRIQQLSIHFAYIYTFIYLSFCSVFSPIFWANL